jgi:hypothetical protein
MSNLVLYPYYLDEYQLYCFDDERTNLKEELFVETITAMIRKLLDLKGVKNPREGFELTFSTSPMSDADATLTWVRSNNPTVKPDTPRSGEAGNFYSVELEGQYMEGWLCPALAKYMNGYAPSKIYVKVDNLPKGVNPIWDISESDSPTAYVGPYAKE